MRLVFRLLIINLVFLGAVPTGAHDLFGAGLGYWENYVPAVPAKLVDPKTKKEFLLKKKLGSGGSGTAYEAIEIGSDCPENCKLVLKVLINQDDFPPPPSESRLVLDQYFGSILKGGALRKEGLPVSFRLKDSQRTISVIQMDLGGESIADHMKGIVLGVKKNERWKPVVRGKELEKRVQQVKMIAQGLFEGYSDLSSSKLLHNDIKPQNVLFRKGTEGYVEIADFDGVTFYDDFVSTWTQYYSSPEVILVNHYDVDASVTSKSDVYSIGLTLHEAVFGDVPVPDHVELDPSTIDGEVAESFVKRSRNEMQAIARQNFDQLIESLPRDKVLRKDVEILRDLVVMTLSFDPDLRPSVAPTSIRFMRAEKCSSRHSFLRALW